jgi:hypothetical protein
LGLYHERGKSGARLTITGREVEYKSLNLIMDWTTGVWQIDHSKDALTPEQKKTRDALAQLGKASPDELGTKLVRNRGSVYKDLVELEKKGQVIKLVDDTWQTA